MPSATRPRGLRLPSALWVFSALSAAVGLLAGCSSYMELQVGAKRLASMKVYQSEERARPLAVNATYHAPLGPPVLPPPPSTAAPTAAEDVMWELNLDDALEALGDLEPTYAELLAHESVRARHLSRESKELIVPYGTTKGTLWSSSGGCPAPSTDARGNNVYECPLLSPDSESENPDDDSWLAFAEYRPSAVSAQVVPLDKGVVAVHVYYEFCAEYLSQSVHPIDRQFSKYDLFLCGERFTFQQTPTLDARQQVLRWLMQRYGRPPDLAGPPNGAETPAIGAADHAVLEQHRWCGPKRGQELVVSCPATVTFAYDGSTGFGAVLFVTPVVYRYIWARRFFTGANFLSRPLAGPSRYLALLFSDPKHYVRGAGPLLCAQCGPEASSLPEKMRQRFTPDPDPPAVSLQ